MKQNFISKLKNLTLLLLLTVSANAQYQLPNAGFEQWNNSWNNKPQPDNWNLSNVEQVGLKFNIGERTTDAHTGQYAVKCQGTEVGALGITAVSPSWVTLGVPWAYLEGISTSTATAGTYGGISWSFRPDTLAVWIKRTSANMNEDMNLVYYSWHGTATNNKYGNKGGGCTDHSITDEESDICKSDYNECKTPSGDAVQVAEGWLRTRTNYKNWTLVKVPIKYFNNDVPTKMNVILSASNYPNKRANDGIYSTSELIADDVSFIYSSQVYDMRFNGIAYSKFNKDKYEYTYELEGDKIPTITCYRSDRQLAGGEITISYGKKDGAATTVTVKAEDGSSTSTYKIYFVSKRDTNQYPKSITINGTELSGFNSSVYDYTVTLPYGTTDKPEIAVVKANEKQTYTISDFSVPGTAKVTVYAENSDYSVTYNITFKSGELSDTTLKDILVNGVSIDGFTPTKTIYKVNVPIGTTGAQEITYVSAYAEGAQTIVVDSKDIKETSTVTVSAPGASSSRVYKISYSVTESSYSYLKDLRVSGETISGFSPATLTYIYPLPLGTASVPEVTYTMGDAYQTVTVENGGIDGTTKIIVKAQNGVNTSIYRISFPLTKSSNSKLADLRVAGSTIEGFSPDVTSYSYPLAVGTTELPEIAWTQGDAYQSVKATYGGVNGTTKIVVTAQSGSVTSYAIAFSVERATNSTLKDIKLDGVSIEGFQPNNKTYSIVLPRGTKTLPEITYTPYDAFQKITKREGGVNGDTYITVKAQSGDVTEYQLSFSVEKSDNAYLNDIKVGGTSIEGFASTTFKYDYELAAGTTILPDITYTTADEYQKVYVTKGGVKGATTLRVVAETGSENTYTINFSVQKSESANLKNIFVGGVALEGFSPEIYSYNYILDASATESPLITVERDGNQEVHITKPQLTGTATIRVTPEEGAVNVYSVKFVSSAGSNCSLDNISLDGVALDGFKPDVTSYDVKLAQGTTSLPLITYVKGDENQSVEMIEGGINGTTTISVMSESGISKVYSLNFTTLKSSNALLSDIKVEGISIEGFSPEIYEYTYKIEKSATSHPAIVAVKSDESSRLDAVIPAINGDVLYYVESEDGTQKSIYTVHLVYDIESDALLSDILVDGIQVEGFASDKFEYEVVREEGVIPAVSYVKGSASQVVTLSSATDKAVINVVAEDGTTAAYTLIYKSATDSNALLSDLQIYNSASQSFVSVEDFDPEIYSYSVTIPKSSSDLYAVNCVGEKNNQTYKITYGKVGEPVVIDVTAEDGVTTAQYSVTFNYEKSSICTLDNLEVNGETVDGFDPERFEYDVVMASNRQGVITYNKSDKSAKVIISDNHYTKTSTIEVIAEDGTTNTYKINFKHDFEGEGNLLKAILVNGSPLSGFASDKYSYTAELLEGKTPVVGYVKNYNAQTVTIATSGNAKSVITVKSNQSGVDDVVYTINYRYKKPYNVVGSINVNGKLIDGFDPYKTKYVIPVTEVPSGVTAYMPDGSDAAKAEDYTDHVQFTTPDTDELSGMVYDLYFHYTGDIIPNDDFTEWTTPKYTVVSKAVKPAGWNVPADAVGEQQVSKWAAVVCGGERSGKAGYEITKVSNSVVGINTNTYQCALAGMVPAVLTLGDVSCTIKEASNSTTGFSGGITFRNTPDKISVKYQYVKAGNDNCLVAIRFFDKNGIEHKYDFTDPNTSSSYVTKDGTLNLSDIHPTKMNIAMNPNGDVWKGLKATNKAEMYVDYVKLSYLSGISAITLDGTALTIDDKSASVTVDSEYNKEPKLEITGEVADQMYNIDYGTESEGVRTISIRSYAEDMTYTDYTVTVTRPISSKAGISSISVGGSALAGFDASVTEYSYPLAAGSHFIPDVTVQGEFAHQSTSVVISGNVATITATSEDGSVTKSYTINFIEADSDNAKLSSIAVEGYEIGYSAETNEYDVTLAAGTTALPLISVKKLYDTQSVVLTESDVEGETAIVVTSADGKEHNTYTIKFTVAPADNTTSKLSLIEVVDAVEQIAFDADTKEYLYDKAAADVVGVAYTRAFTEDAMVVTVNSDSIVWNISNATSATENEYKLNFTNTKSENVKLAAIMLNGVVIEGFNPGVFEYSVDVTTRDNRQVDALLAEEGQTIESTYDADEAKFTFVVTSASGNKTQIYTVYLNVIKNKDNTLSAIVLDGTALADFDPAVTEYNIELEKGATTIPEIVLYGNAYDQAHALTLGTMESSTLVEVTSESGDAQTYVLNFNVKPSDNALLERISANYVKLPDFAPDQFNYTVEVGVGEDTPIITYVKGDASQTVEENLLTDAVVFTVTAASGDQNIYTVTFDRKLASGSDLADITLGGSSIDGFAPQKYEYNVVLDYGTTVLPAIETVMGDVSQTIKIETAGVNGDAVINVASQDGKNISVYTIHFTVAKSHNANLNMIYVDGVEVEEFDPAKTEYEISLPVGVTLLPEVIAEPGDAEQQVVKENNESKVIFDVTAGDGVTTKRYSVNFIINLSKDATLNMIYIDGDEVSEYDAFDKEKFEYNVVMPLGTDLKKVTVDYQKGTELQSVEKSDIDGGVAITVTAQDAAYENVYIVNLDVEKSTNTALQDLISGGKSVDGFDADVTNYNITLPIGTKYIPDVTYTAGDEYQVIEKIVAQDSLLFTIKVSAQNGDSRTYSVTYDKELSHNATLRSITIGDERQLIPSFDSEHFTYRVELPFGTTKVPTIDYEKGDEGQRVETDYTESVTGESSIKVTAADGVTTNRYVIAFTLKPCDITTLDMIYYNDNRIPDYTKGDNDYDVELPYGTIDAPVVTFDLSEPEHQSAVVTTDKVESGWKSVITVMAESEDQNEYIINFTVAPDSENRLKDIKIFGKSILGFDPDKESYSFELEAYSDSSLIPFKENFEYVKMNDIETVELSQPSRESVILKVTAQSGAVRNYVIKTTIRISDNTDLDGLYYKDVMVEGFDPAIYDYTIKLPYGSNTVDKELVTYKAHEKGQSVMVVKDNLDVEVQVSAQDGKSVTIYTIHFVPDDFDPTVVPTEDDVCITSTLDGGWKFTTRCKNLTIILTDLTGRFIAIATIPTVDPNCEDICSPEAEGYVFYGETNQVVTYNFLYAQQKRILTGKFKCSANR